MNAPSSPLILLAGPTASGKSAIAMKLAERIGGEIVNADSVQIYRYLDIGTSKPVQRDREKIIHHLLDIRNPDEEFSVSEYQQLALTSIHHIRSKGKIPLVVGGTGLYLQSLIRRYTYGTKRNEAARQKADELFNTHGKEKIYRWLCDSDPRFAGRVHSNDRYRIQRALEIVLTKGGSKLVEEDRTDLPSRPPDETVGKKISILSREDSSEAPMNFRLWILEPDRKWLYDRINLRVDRMMDDGFLAEVQGLLDRGYTGDLKPLRTLGYRQLIRYLEGEYSLERAVPLIKQETRRFAKRQFTWFRKSESTHRISLSSEEDLDRATEMICNDPEIQTLVDRPAHR